MMERWSVMEARVVALALLSACTVSKRPEYTVKLNEEYGHLGNGLRVILLPDRAARLVEIDVRYEVGSKEDPPGKAGLAHLVEHVIFQQRQAGADQPTIGAALRQNSIAYNAWTVWDYTHYRTLARAED